jgi:hypothetical protein
MKLYRSTIGIQFNRKMFRLPSVGGLVVDQLLNGIEEESTLGVGFFTQISYPNTREGEYSISLIDDKKNNSLSIFPNQFVFKKTDTIDGAAVNIEKTISEFKVLWKLVNQIIKFPETRRIGMVGEFVREEKSKDKGALELLSALTKLDAPESSKKFHLTYESRDLNSDGNVADIESDDFINTIYTFYLGGMDETPLPSSTFMNVDVQKYYNPAKKDAIRELNSMKSLFSKKENEFKESMRTLGLA